MDEPLPLCTLAVVIVTVLTSYLGFTKGELRDRFIFEPIRVLRDSEYYRIITSGFLHADWIHLLFNMASLYLFGRDIELYFGAGTLLAIYFAGIVGGGLVSLYVHRNHDYLALGASGGVCGVIFGAIFLMPGGEIGLFFLPVYIPDWVYAILFLLISFVGMRRRLGNIGHDAHLGGALVGLLTATAMYPYITHESPLLYSTVCAVTLGMMIYSYKYPAYMSGTSRSTSVRLVGMRQNLRVRIPRRKAATDEQKLDLLLDKISRQGIENLSSSERKELETISQRRDAS